MPRGRTFLGVVSRVFPEKNGKKGKKTKKGREEITADQYATRKAHFLQHGEAMHVGGGHKEIPRTTNGGKGMGDIDSSFRDKNCVRQNGGQGIGEGSGSYSHRA